ncbi:hypothetical protein C8Q77DRAFT_330989 [Trametes polyzona]|nr:hypothetical protein C8Q77DRAFT_330989 [Trametes polyzona]
MPAGVQRGKPIQLPIEITAPIAKKLETHERFLTLLRDVITMQKWPASDKTPDQLLKEGYKAGAEPLASPTKNAPRQESVQASPTGEGSSRKRPAEAVDQLVAQPRPKRSKSNPHIATRRSSRKRS